MTAFPVATNPFLSAAGPVSSDQFSLPSTKLNQQMGSLTLNPTLTGNNNWSSLGSVPLAPTTSLLESKASSSLPSSSSLDGINPFATTSLASGSLVSSNSASLFSEFVQFPSSNGFAKSDFVSSSSTTTTTTTDAANKNTTDLTSNQGWGFTSAAATTVKANSSASLGDLWQ